MSLTREQFSRALVESGITTADQLHEFWKQLPVDARPVDGDGFARRLVAAGKLSPFQASEILAGRGNRLVLEPYIILDKLGGGGMGLVYKARHRTMKRMVAVKVLSAEMVSNANAVKRFQREAEVAARLSHENIVQAHDAGEKAGIHYLVMELVEGSDLTALVKQRGKLPIDEAVDYVLQAARGLAYAHGEGVVHRDIKPGNLLLDKHGKVKILDMGLARLDAPGDENNLTRTGEMMGTPDYMAPEQALDTKHADARSDVYSLGCTLYRLLTGELPYPGDTFVQMLMAHCEAPIPDLRQKRKEVPQSLNLIYQRMIAKQPQDRQQSMAEVVAELEAFLGGKGTGGTPTRSVSEGPEAGGRGSGVGNQGIGGGNLLGGVSPALSPAPMQTSYAAAISARVAAAPKAAGLEETIGYPKAKEDTASKMLPSAPQTLLEAAGATSTPKKSNAVLYGVIVVGMLVIAGIAAAVVMALGG